MKRVILKRGEEERVRNGHPWVFDNQVERVLEGFGNSSHSASLEPGETADIESCGKEYLGRAFVNPKSKIIARVYSHSKEGVDKGFFKRRIREASERRLLAGIAPDQSCRLVYAEADGLPGLIVDRYCGVTESGKYESSCEPVQKLQFLNSNRGMAGSPNPPFREICMFRSPVGARNCEGCSKTVRASRTSNGVFEQPPCKTFFCVQFLIAGMDSRRGMILEALRELFEPAGIIEKTPPRIRELEGLEEREAESRGEIPDGGVVIQEGPCLFTVDLKAGQKTGHFLDQRENHSLAAFFALNAAKIHEKHGFSGENLEKNASFAPFRVLDAFCYTGGFGLCIAKTLQNAGLAVEVTCVDSSAPALESLRSNAALNGLSGCVSALEADVRAYLSSRAGDFDMVILDPPAFAKTKSSLEPAMRAYTEINALAIRRLSGARRKGGLLVTCSCSQALDAARFHAMLSQAALESTASGKKPPSLREYAFRGAPPDHPALASYPQSSYLKASFCVVG